MAKSKGENAVPKKTGRPSLYNQDTVAAICDRLALGESLRSICKDESMPSLNTVIVWLRNELGFQLQYARARELQAELIADEIMEIVDDGKNDTYKDEQGNTRTDYDVIARSKLRLDARKWWLGKILPKKYGDKLDVTSGGDKISPTVVERVVISK